jgi:uncharacterized membrane protein YgdD (TMEM256/DUF423 family)
MRIPNVTVRDLSFRHGILSFCLGMTRSLGLRLAALLGFLGVALGAFGAHGLSEILAKNGRADAWATAVLYHLVHACILAALSLARPPRAAWWLFAAGIIIFSGSLYLLALTNLRWLGAVTPLGGLCLLGGWLALAIEPTAPPPETPLR